MGNLGLTKFYGDTLTEAEVRDILLAIRAADSSSHNRLLRFAQERGMLLDVALAPKR